MELTNIEEKVEVKVEEKPYQFKILDATDLFVMLRLVKKIGVENVKKLISGELISSGLLTGKAQATDEMYAMVGMIAFDVAGLLIDRLSDCEQELYALFEKTSNLTAQEIMKLDIVTFTEMIVDFIKKEELLGFIQAVLKFFK